MNKQHDKTKQTKVIQCERDWERHLVISGVIISPGDSPHQQNKHDIRNSFSDFTSKWWRNTSSRAVQNIPKPSQIICCYTNTRNPYILWSKLAVEMA